MKYIISVFYDDAEVTVKTNNSEIAIMEMLNADQLGVEAHVMDGETGELLALVNHPEQFATPEFSLMTLGYLAKQTWEEDEEDGGKPEPEQEPVFIPDILDVMSAICGQFGIVPTPNESEIVS